MKINAIKNISNTGFKKTQKYKHQDEQSKRISPLQILNKGLFVPKYQKSYMKFVEGMQIDGIEMAKLAEKYAREFVVY